MQQHAAKRMKLLDLLRLHSINHSWINLFESTNSKQRHLWYKMNIFDLFYIFISFPRECLDCFLPSPHRHCTALFMTEGCPGPLIRNSHSDIIGCCSRDCGGGMDEMPLRRERRANNANPTPRSTQSADVFQRCHSNDLPSRSQCWDTWTHEQ